ncbi:gp65 [Sphingomonas phage PAU]|uniref:gp65 n=1 Tax=Sphingomonas phage PAU TaxID=1150991 RepID=UPI00025731CB|nr:gp65 [Sphingomonas phage PAU]AFF28063.1 gp65 [Sphingomonas phage PAU]
MANQSNIDILNFEFPNDTILHSYEASLQIDYNSTYNDKTNQVTQKEGFYNTWKPKTKKQLISLHDNILKQVSREMLTEDISEVYITVRANYTYKDKPGYPGFSTSKNLVKKYITFRNGH